MAASSRPNRERAFTFRNVQGETLVGTAVVSSSPKTIVLCHGFSDHRNTPLILALAEALDAASFSSLRFDFSGNGDSEGTFEFGNYAKEVEDLRQVISLTRQGSLSFDEGQPTQTQGSAGMVSFTALMGLQLQSQWKDILWRSVESSVSLIWGQS